MYHYWKKLTAQQRSEHINQALHEVVNFTEDISLGYPASKLDGNVFFDNGAILQNAPTLRAFITNPNNIGCHTLGTSEKAFKGTQTVEIEVLSVIAVDILKAAPDSFDGYIAPGGTEANLQALWIYRNYFMNNHKATLDEIAILASEDTHYSIPKGANLMMIDWLKVPVGFDSREIDKAALKQIVTQAKAKGKKYFIVVVNMGTTMFGSVDGVSSYTDILDEQNLDYKLHIDGAYGGFVYPFSNPESDLNFANPKVSSITIDAHKVLQAPYGTGIFVCRKGLIENVLTKEAEYVEGMDLTICGSRSGANAVAVWMILFTHGPYGWFERISVLQMRTSWLCHELDQLNISYFRDPFMNIVTIKSEHISEELADKFQLVPQKHDASNQWYKVVLMGHVEIDTLMLFVAALKESIR